jgi:ATP-dependent RNA helicase DDX41
VQFSVDSCFSSRVFSLIVLLLFICCAVNQPLASKCPQEFALAALVKPVCVNVGRAGAANLDVIQEVEYVKMEAKIVYLLECLQKTAPPVLVFCSNQADVDDIHMYLLLKGVRAVAIHGGKDQSERIKAIQQFKVGEKDVLVATDVASKGLDFPDIQHVINYDMPKEIEDYVHRIGRTGRCGKTGVATSFINRDCEETLLLDLKHLLKVCDIMNCAFDVVLGFSFDDFVLPVSIVFFLYIFLF